MSARPGRIKTIVEAKFDKTDPAIFKAKHFVDKVDEIWNLVREQAMKAKGGSGTLVRLALYVSRTLRSVKRAARNDAPLVRDPALHPERQPGSRVSPGSRPGSSCF